MAEVLSRPAEIPEPETRGSQFVSPREQILEKLYGYGGAIEGVGQLKPCQLDTPIEELQRRLQRDGVV